MIDHSKLLKLRMSLSEAQDKRRNDWIEKLSETLQKSAIQRQQEHVSMIKRLIA